MMWSMNDALLGVFMRSETQSKLKKIKLASTILRVACKVVLALIVIGFLMATIAILANRGGSVGFFRRMVTNWRLNLRSTGAGACDKRCYVGGLVHMHLCTPPTVRQFFPWGHIH